MEIAIVFSKLPQKSCAQKQINFLGDSKLGSRFLERDPPPRPTMWEAWPPSRWFFSSSVLFLVIQNLPEAK